MHLATADAVPPGGLQGWAYAGAAGGGVRAQKRIDRDGGTELVQAACLATEFLGLRDIGERQAHAIGHDGEATLHFSHVPGR